MSGPASYLHRDLLSRHARTVERIRRLSVRPMPGERGQYGRLSGWMRMTPAAGTYADTDAPARRSIAGDEVYVVCPGLELDTDAELVRIFHLGESAWPTRPQLRLGELDGDPVLVRVEVSGAIYASRDGGLHGTLTFDLHYPLG